MSQLADVKPGSYRAPDHRVQYQEPDPKRDALDVANYFIKLSGYTKTPMQIQKMAYIAHGYMLGVYGMPLVRDRAEAWKRGPVFPKVFHEFKRWRFNPIGEIRYEPEPFTEKQQNILDEVFGSYGRYCGYYLSQITHDDDDTITPWRQCYVEGVMHTPIPDSVTQTYYKQLYDRFGYEFL